MTAERGSCGKAAATSAAVDSMASRCFVVGIGGPGVSANGSWLNVCSLSAARSSSSTSLGAVRSSAATISARPAARRSGLSVMPVGAGGS